MKKNLLGLFVAIFCAGSFVSCDKEENPTVPTSQVKIMLEAPESTTLSLAKLPIVVKNLATAKTDTVFTDAQGGVTAKLEYGLYDFTVNTSNAADTLLEKNLAAAMTNVRIDEQAEEVKLSLTVSASSNTWVIKELYFAGSKNPTNGKGYFNDQYIEIYNNSDKTLYADGLCIGATRQYSNMPFLFWNKGLPERVATDFIYQVPGNGTQHPVAPGTSIVIAQQGLNHKAINPGSVDLSKATFEWFDDNTQDVDVAEVPNMKSFFKAFAMIQIIHNRGGAQVFIFKSDKPWGKLAAEMADSVQGYRGMMYGYFVPTRCIIDGVATGPKEGLVSRPLPVSVDAGNTFITNTYTGLAVRRKQKEVVNGRIVLQDTNNSTDDFLTDVVPSPFTFPQ